MIIIICGKDEIGKPMMKKNRSELVLLMFMVFFGCDQKPAKQVIAHTKVLLNKLLALQRLVSDPVTRCQYQPGLALPRLGCKSPTKQP